MIFHGCIPWAIMLALAACAHADTDIAPGQRPELSSDEAGLWTTADEQEEKLRTSGNLLRDPQLKAYVSGVACKLAGPRCPDIRVYIVREPDFNAVTAANGMMQVSTGLLLRAQNEAQLAAVVGHEIGHYIRRHSWQKWRDQRATSVALTVYKILKYETLEVLSHSSLDTASPSARDFLYSFDAPERLVGLASFLVDSRDVEREADDIALALMVENGYDLHEGGSIWRQLIRERKAAGQQTPMFFLETHPAAEERAEVFAQRAEQLVAAGVTGTNGREAFLAATQDHRAQWLSDDLALQEWARSLELLRILGEAGAASGELKYYEGELYRQRGQPGDVQRALSAYREAAASAGTPAEVHRELGQTYLKFGDINSARIEFEKYLEMQPDALDRTVIQQLLE